jgi:hypothetical protein
MLTNIFLQTRDIIQGISIATPSCWGKQFAAKLQAAAKLGVGAKKVCSTTSQIILRWLV